MDGIFVALYNLNVEFLTPDVRVLKGEGFGQQLKSREGRVLLLAVVPLRSTDQKACSLFLPHWGYSKKAVICKKGRGFSPESNPASQPPEW